MKFKSLYLTLASVLLSNAAICRGASTPDIVDQWRFTRKQPAGEWQRVEFDDSAWERGNGGFGTPGTPNARVGTIWKSSDIWLRKTIDLKDLPPKSALLVYHDEDAEIHINGTLVKTLEGYVTGYKVFPLTPEQRSLLKEGANLLAVHCRQTAGGQFIDVHLVEEDKIPELPQPVREPFASALITLWGEAVTENSAWREYPRPQMRRKSWTNLNGRWDYAITPVKQTEFPAEWSGKILVPFCLESRLGGVRKMLTKEQALWYRRTFELEPSTTTLLNFEAVDYRCSVFVNGKPVGEHTGGNTPFSLDISGAARPGNNELVVRVEDEQEGYQLRGKQVLNPHGIWYTQVSGIWQTVWLEQVEQSYIADLAVRTDAAGGVIAVTPTIIGTAATIAMTVRDDGKTVAEATGLSGKEMQVKVENPRLWSPGSPFLYSLEIKLLDSTGNIIDQVDSYAGIRSVGKRRDAAGHMRFTLNGQEIFHWGPLDQGWWPDGLLTPPSDAAMKFEIEWLRKAGFNMIRKHIKVEPRRYYYHCDKAGMMVWQDQVSAGHGPRWTFLKPDPQDADWPTEHHRQFMLELERMIDNLENHPCVVCWVPFNEAWGQHRTVEVGKWVAARDPSRLINIASGGNFWPVGDIVDAHSYPHPGFPFQEGEGGRFDGLVKVVGEFGGHGFPVKGHLWDAERDNWGYGGLPKNESEYKERFRKSIEILNDLRVKGISGGVYTQTTDVEGEINGLMTYDRKVIKIPAEELAEITGVLFK